MSHASPSEICSTALVGSAPQTLPVKADQDLFDVGPDGRLLFGAPQGRYQAFNPANNQTQTLITLPAANKLCCLAGRRTDARLPTWFFRGNRMTQARACG